MTSDKFTPGITSDTEELQKWASENLIQQKVVPKFVPGELGAKEPLLRFMDITKLFDLLVTRKLFLPTLGQLMASDPYECRARRNLESLSIEALQSRAKHLEQYAPEPTERGSPPLINDLLPYVPVSRFDEELKRLSRPELEEAVAYLELQKLKSQLVCGCFYGSNDQSDAMWRIYASQIGVSIQTTPARLQDALSLNCLKVYAEKVAFYLGRVEYTESTTCTEERPPWLMKKEAYRHEHEVRLYSEIPNELHGSLYLDVDLNVLLEAIEITPLAPSWQIRGIKAAISAMLKNAGVDLEPKVSKHLRTPQKMWPPAQRRFLALLANRKPFGDNA